jgi:hypothetical protein
MRDLPGRVDASVGTPGHGQLDRHPQDQGQPFGQRRLYGALITLGRPPGEVRSVVGDVEPQTDEPAVPVSGNGGLDAAIRRAQLSSDSVAPALVKPAASAASVLSNHTSATVWSYHWPSGSWYFIESALPLMV